MPFAAARTSASCSKPDDASLRAAPLLRSFNSKDSCEMVPEDDLVSRQGICATVGDDVSTRGVPDLLAKLPGGAAMIGMPPLSG